MTAAGFKDHFSTASDRYAAHRPDYPPELFDWLASLCQRHDLARDCTTPGQGDPLPALRETLLPHWANPQQRLAVDWPPHLRAGRKAGDA